MNDPPQGFLEAIPGSAGIRPCDRCGSTESRTHCRAVDPLSGERFGLLRCRRCGLLRTDFRRPAQELSRYYGPNYFGPGGRRFFCLVERAVGGCRLWRARIVARRFVSPGRILDLGCGRGLMLASLKRMGWECAGTEGSAVMAEEVRNAYDLDIRSGEIDPLPFPDGTFNVVTAWHSLEHMEKPVKVLREVFRVLQPGGLLVVEVPAMSSLQARLGGGRWFHLDVPRHLYHFSRRELSEILTEMGFLIQEEGTFSLEYGPFGMLQTLLNRITYSDNALYQFLRKPELRSPVQCKARARALRGVWDVLATLLLVAPLGVCAIWVEVVACLLGRGGVARIVAFRPNLTDETPASRG